MGNRHGYQGHVFDPRIGLVDMRNRTYRPSIGRFLSRDPIGLLGGSNHYAFVDSSPLLYRDPFGLGRVKLGLPPLSETSTTLEQGYLYEQYQEAKRAADNPNNSWFQRIASAGLATLASPVALAEEYLVRQPVNQFVNAGTRAGEHAARSYLFHQQGETAQAIAEGLHATVNASVGVVTGIGLAAPAAGAGARVAAPVAPRVAARRPMGPTVEELGAATRTMVGICFAAGTLVHTERGLIAIEEVKVGDRVWSRNEQTGEDGYRRVVRTFVTPKQPTLELHFVGDSGATERLEATVEHPFWVVDRGWVAARDLRPGDEVYTSHGGWVRVSSGTWTVRTTTVYNFEVEEFHTYFVGEAGLWVHNNSSYAVGRARTISQGLRSSNCWGECFAHADNLITALKADGIRGSELIVNPGNKWVSSNVHGALGAQGSVHRAVRVGDTVFDNLRPGGIPYSQWIDDLGGSEFLRPPYATLTETPF